MHRSARFSSLLAFASATVVGATAGSNAAAQAGPVRLGPAVIGKVTEYKIPTAKSAPWGVASGSDGALWFTESGADKIGRVTTSGQFAEYAVPGTNLGLHGITAGPDGALWFCELNANAIGRITTSGAITQYAVPGYSSPLTITAGPDGALWFSEYRNVIGRISTAGVVQQYTIRSYPSYITQAFAIASGSDGALWFTANELYSDPVDNFTVVGRMSTSGQNKLHIVPSNGTGQTVLIGGITNGPDGALWFTGSGGSGPSYVNFIGRVAPATPQKFTEYPVGAVGASFIATGPDGALWFTERYANRIGRITTTGQITTYSIHERKIATVYGITAGPEGAMWFTEYDAGKIGRITTGPGIAQRR